MRKKRLTKLIVILLFYISPIIDNIYGYMYYQLGKSIPIAILFRSFLMFLMILVLKDSSSFVKKTIIVSVCLLVIISIWSILYGADFFSEINFLIRLLFIPLVVCFFSRVNYVYSKEVLYKHVMNYGLIISTIVLICFIFGFGNYSYGGGSEGNYGFGVKGYFKATNDLSLTVILSLVLSLAYYIKYSLRIWYLAGCLLIAIGGILIGSRVGIVFSSFFIFGFVLYLAFFSKKAVFFLRIILCTLLVYIAILFGIFIFSNLDTYALAKFEKENIENARTELTDAAVNHIESFSGISIFIGEGYHSLASKVAKVSGFYGDEKNVEADGYELIGSYGYGLGAIFIIYYLYFGYIGLVNLRKYRDVESFAVFLALFLFLLIGFLAGHAMYNTMVAPIYGVLSSLVMYNKNKTYNH